MEARVHLARMTMQQFRLKALVVTAKPERVRLWQRALADLNIEMEPSRSASDAAEKLARGKYEAVAVDCDGVVGGTGLLMAVRSAPTSHHAVIFAMASAGRLSSLSGIGINFVLATPVNPEYLARCLRAAYGSMMADQRRYFRYRVDIPATLEVGGRRSEARITNISESGLRVLCRDLADTAPLRLRFTLPGSGDVIDARAAVVWSNSAGHAGLRFLDLLPSRRAALARWLAERLEQAAHDQHALEAGA